MRKTASVGILGAGALGVMYAAKLSQVAGLRLAFLADASRAKRLESVALTYNGTPLSVPVCTPEQSSEPFDLIIVAVKAHQLASALAMLPPCVGEGTSFISVLNGLTSEQVIAERFGAEKVLHAIAVGMDAVRTGDAVTSSAEGKILYGEQKNMTRSERVERISRLFTEAGIVHDTPQDMLFTIWWKWMVNVGINQASALLGLPYGAFQQEGKPRDLMISLMREVLALSQHAGVCLGEDALVKWFAVLATLGAEGKTSMLQDVEARRKTEVDLFATEAVRLGEMYGVPTPENRRMQDAMRMMESSWGIS